MTDPDLIKARLARHSAAVERLAATRTRLLSVDVTVNPGRWRADVDEYFADLAYMRGALTETENMIERNEK